MTNADIINANDSNFGYQVLSYSKKKPVVVDFWADWCMPCKTLTPLLEQLADENQGEFRLAKVNIEKNPQLTQQYNIYNLPSVKAFQNGQIFNQFSGAKSDQQVREFINQIASGPASLLLEKAQSLLRKEKWNEAEDTSREILDKHPNQLQARLILAKSLLSQAQGSEALEMLDNFPASPEYRNAETLRPLAQSLTNFNEECFTRKTKVDAIYIRAFRLIKIGNIPAALDGLLDVLRIDKGYRKGEAHQVVLGLFALLGSNHPTTREYRSELANILF